MFPAGAKGGGTVPPPPVGQHIDKERNKHEKTIPVKKRFPAFFLALALCLGLAAPAFAANAGTSAETYTWISEDFPYVYHNLECRTRAVDNAYKYGEAQDYSVSLQVVPTSEYFQVGVYNLAEAEEGAIIIGAYSDPDGDGVYDQRLFQAKKDAGGSITGVTVLPLPEDGVYKTTSDVITYAPAIVIPGFEKVGDGDYAFSADRLHELLGDNTLIFFISLNGEEILGSVLLSAGAFDDVPGLRWYSDTVAWASDKGIALGTGDGIFEPGTDCTQSQILTFLWRAERKPQAAKAPVTVEEWYQDAINWAYEKGMIDDSFDGSKPCTRSAAVSYIWQAFDKPTAKASSFTDVDANAAYAKAVDWAVEKGITKGDGSEDTFAPDKVCTRGQIATFLYRAYHN